MEAVHKRIYSDFDLGLAAHQHRKMAAWDSAHSKNLLQIKKAWANRGETKYQLVGDNLDKTVFLHIGSDCDPCIINTIETF